MTNAANFSNDTRKTSQPKVSKFMIKEGQGKSLSKVSVDSTDVIDEDSDNNSLQRSGLAPQIHTSSNNIWNTIFSPDSRNANNISAPLLPEIKTTLLQNSQSKKLPGIEEEGITSSRRDIEDVKQRGSYRNSVKHVKPNKAAFSTLQTFIKSLQ